METIGSFSNPYLYSDYQTMSNDGTWNGGWVIRDPGSNNERKSYITADGCEENDSPEGILGSQQNPFSYVAYSEMISHGTWTGGWILNNNDCEYMPAQGEGGEGCGCGCGCGSIYGYGNILGGNDHMVMHLIEFDFTWEDGTATNGVEVHIGAKLYDASIDSVSVKWTWNGNYTILFSVSYRHIAKNTRNTMESSYHIPEFYRV